MPYSDAPAAESETSAASGGKWHKFKVDLWATDLNDVELGLFKDAQHQAKSRQFTKDMNVIGQVRADGERTGLIGWREGLWEEGQGMDRRLVLKLFSETLNWTGSLDLMLGRSLQHTHGSGVPTPAYSLNLARHDQVIQLERSARKLPLFPESFSFFLLDEDRARYFRLRRKRFKFGADYALIDETGRTIGHVSQKLVNLGGAWSVKLRTGASDARLEATLSLFCAMLRFNGKARRHVAQLYRQVVRGKADTKLDHQEDDLYMNPRRVR